MLDPIRVIVAGSRSFLNYNLLCAHMDHYLTRYKLNPEMVTIISGGAKGADKLGELYAERNGFKLEFYPAEWDKYGLSAGYKRNELMAQNATHCVVFWDGVSKGAKHMIDIAKAKGLRLVVVPFESLEGPES